jgi:hypothetical protein
VQNTGEKERVVEITGFIWLEDIVEKLEQKHGRALQK